MSGLVLYTVPPSVATVALVLRGISRARPKVPFGWDDFFAVAAGCFFWAYSGVAMWNVLAPPKDPSSPAAALKAETIVLKALYVNTLLTVCVLSSAKLSILCLYKRIFWPNPRFNISVNVLIAVASTWWAACFILGILRCLPVAAAWNPALAAKATCYSLETAFLATELINCITEVLMIVLPINMIRKLHLPLRRKIGIISIFAVGVFVVITSVVRIAEVYSPASGNEGIVKSGIWGNIQMCTAICTACLPTYRGLLPKNHNFFESLQQWYSQLLSRRQHSVTGDVRSDVDDLDNLDSNSAYSNKVDAYSTGERNRSSEHTDNIPLNAIAVEHKVAVDREATSNLGQSR